MANIVSIPPVSPHLEQKQKLVYNDALDTSSIQNILLISCKVVESQQFFDSASSNTFPIIYSQNSAKIELLELLRNKFQNGVKRIAFAFHDPLNGDETFLDNKSFFEENDLIENQTTFSENVSFLTDLITEFKVEHCDFLACNSLQYSNWKKYYELLNKMTNVISGASNDNTGNIQYGADWVMENTNENVKDIYFTSSIDNYTSSLLLFIVGDLNYSTSGTSATVTGASTSAPSNWILTIPSTVTNNSITYNVTSIGQGAFSDKLNLESVIIPNSVTNIDNNAFRNCYALTSFTIGSGLTTLNGNDIFVDDASLSTFIVDASNANFSSFEGVLFNNDKTKLVYYPPGKIGTSYTFPTSVTNINNQAFFKCINLTTITIPNIVTVVGWNAFQGCTGLTSVTIGTGFTSISDSMFNGCSGLTTVTIPSTVTSIGGYAFASCSGLTSVTIGSNVTSIGDDAFERCSALTSVTIPDKVTTIGQTAFWLCSTLTSVTIGSGVTYIDFGAFSNCDALTTVYFMGNIPVINNGLNFNTNTSDTAYVLTSATLLDPNAVAGTTVTDYLSPTFFTNVLIQSSFPSSDICFRKGTPVRTDQGLIHIDKINPSVHTIRNKKIVAITKTVTQEKYLVCFEKDSLGPNMPSQKTFISANHKIFNKGTMIKAKEFVGKYENIYKVKYTGEVLYNVLMEEYDRIVVNNLICESLHPENTIAQLYTILQGFNLEEQEEIIKQYNEFTLKNKVSSTSGSSSKR